jgi:hypothetical protein
MRTTSFFLMNNNQYGFLPKKGTMDAIIQVLDDCAMAKDQREAVTAIFFGFAKAFDLVNHEVLLSKLERLLPAWLCRWIAAYLSDRTQRVKVGAKLQPSGTGWKQA